MKTQIVTKIYSLVHFNCHPRPLRNIPLPSIPLCTSHLKVFFSSDDKNTAMLLEEKGANVHERDREGHSGRNALKL